MTNFTFTDRKSYLKWKEEWRSQYQTLSREIHERKRSRKQFKYEYRAKGDNTSQRRTKVGDNPHYDPRHCEWSLLKLRSEASAMMIGRKMAKKLSIEMKETRIIADIAA